MKCQTKVGNHSNKLRKLYSKVGNRSNKLGKTVGKHSNKQISNKIKNDRNENLEYRKLEIET